MGGSGPPERFGVSVVEFDVIVDGIDEFSDRIVGPSSDPFVCDLGKEPFDEVKPGTGGWHEVEVESQVLGEPGLHGWVLVGSVIVEDHVQVEIARRFPVDFFEKGEKLFVPMSLFARTDDGAVEHVERGKQRGRSMAFVVVG